MDLENIIIFGANSHISKKIFKTLNFRNIICISKNLKVKKSKKIKLFDSYIGNELKINKYIKNNTTVIFFNNLSVDNLILNKSLTELKQEIEGSVLSVFENAKLISKQLIKKKTSSFIFVGSSRGLNSDVGISGYSISKNALVGLMNSFAEEFSIFGIRSNYLALGYFDSPLFNKIKDSKKLLSKTTLKKKGDYQSIINEIEFLSKSSYVTKSIIKVDGGY